VSTIKEIKRRLKISDYVGKFVQLKPAGSSASFMGRCPFPDHEDSDPSFHVYDDSCYFKCYGCGKEGDMLDFYCLMEGKETGDAVAYFASLAGISHERPQTAAEKKRLAHRALLQDINAFYRETLFSSKGEDALKYLLSRGLSETIIRAFSLGFAPGFSGNEIVRIAKKHGVTEARAVELGILKVNGDKNPYDPFFKRIIFPIYNGHGSAPAGFGGRILDEGAAKYINSVNSEHFVKGDLLYGYILARQNIAATKTAVLMEGYMDVLAMHDKGFSNSAGVLGTAITGNQIRLLKKAHANRVIFLMDGDKAGLEAAKKGVGRAMAGGLMPYIAIMQPDEDPSSILQQPGGPDVIQQLLDTAEPGLEYVHRCLADNPIEFHAWIHAIAKETEDKLLRLIWLARIAKLMGMPGEYLVDALELCKEN